MAFSGEVHDPDSGEEPFSETSAALNPGLKGRDIADAFTAADSHLLLVANKFQTGSISRCCAACMSIAGSPASRLCKRCRG